jgi:hypothetical protein
MHVAVDERARTVELDPDLLVDLSAIGNEQVNLRWGLADPPQSASRLVAQCTGLSGIKQRGAMKGLSGKGPTEADVHPWKG